MIENRRVLITVKTYPTLSKKYSELVCTAGIRDDGKWIRIYPLPFRKLDLEQKYKKYQWIQLPLRKSTSDYRPESYEVVDWNQIELLGKPLDRNHSWRKRRNILFAKNQAFNDLSQLVSLAKDDKLSLAIFKPTRLIKFIAKPTTSEWGEDKLKILEKRASQLSLFQTPEETKREFKVVRKLPFKFSYQFEDINGQESTQMIEDWEIGSLYWNCLRDADGNKEIAVEKVRQKYWDDFLKTDLHFFLGTTLQYHRSAPNPFVIIGVFPAPLEKQPPLYRPFEVPLRKLN